MTKLAAEENYLKDLIKTYELFNINFKNRVKDVKEEIQTL